MGVFSHSGDQESARAGTFPALESEGMDTESVTL